MGCQARESKWTAGGLASAVDDDLAPRCVKDGTKERLFARRRDLFTDLSLVSMDTTTLSFHGGGGENPGAHSHWTNPHGDLRQMVLHRELAALCRVTDVTAECDELICDLERLQEATIDRNGMRVSTRTPVSGQAGQASGTSASRARRTGANTPPEPSSHRNVAHTPGHAGVTC